MSKRRSKELVVVGENPEEEKECATYIMAMNHVTRYALSECVDTQKRHNLLSAAQKCGCRSCVSAYLEMLEWLTQDETLAQQVARSQGVRRR